MKLQISTAVASVLFAATAAHADVVISSKPTQNMSCSDGVCTPTAPNAVLNAADLTNMLASGDLKVTTGSGATNIVVKAPVSWASASRLTLDAMHSVEIENPVMVTGTGAVTITANDGSTGGDLIFDGKGNVTFWDLSSSLIVNGNSYTLVSDIATLASNIANNPSGFYALANDYDASLDGTYASAPIATDFSGTFEGLGHAIANLKIITTDFYVGLFRQVLGNLRDTYLLKVAIQGNSGTLEVGSLIGISKQATIVGCYATGSIVTSDASAVGGLVGASGDSFDGSIVRSHAAVSISVPDDSAAGGLVGVSEFSISLSYATGRVKAGNNAYAGGLTGLSSGDVSQTYATGNVSAGQNATVGGLIGSTCCGKVENSYATGAVESRFGTAVGGFAGLIESGSVESSYSTGLVKGGKSGGGFFGSGRLGSKDYWDTDTSGKTKRQGCAGSRCTQGIKGLTTEEFLAGLPDGFDPNIWGEKKAINGGFPYLVALPPK